MTHEVGPKGQVVIPKDLRDEFGIEPGELDRPVMSWSNLGEVFCIVRRDYDDEQAHAVVRDLRLRLRLDLPSEHRILTAAALEADHRMAYTDAFAAATAVAHDATLLTGDPELLVEGFPWRWEDRRTATQAP